MADVELDAEAIAALRKKRQFKKFTFRGIELDKLLDLSHEELLNYVNSRARRRMQRGMKRKPLALIKKLRKAKAGKCFSFFLLAFFLKFYFIFCLACGALDKPVAIKTHLRNMLIVPEMIGSQLAVYNGKVFNQIEVKPEMVGHYLGEFSISYRPVRHGRPGIGSTNSSRFIPLK
jgi:small subunit ribosomal protein S15e